MRLGITATHTRQIPAMSSGCRSLLCHHLIDLVQRLYQFGYDITVVRKAGFDTDMHPLKWGQLTLPTHA
jgi:hypothetical protein